MHLVTREEEIARKLEEQRKAMEAERCIAIVKQMEADRAEKEKALDDAKAVFESEKEKALKEQRIADRENSVRQMLRHDITAEKVAEILNVPLEDILEIGKRDGILKD
ncbi:MAG: hypothetical protein II467_07215 [Bacilli bacterium]|nr:hypothetical protein [Bacilli bacterium]